MNTFKRKALFSAVISGLLMADSVVQSARANAMRIVGAFALMFALMAMGMTPDASALTVGMLLMAGNAPFPIQPELTAIAIAYQNRTAIADEVMPRLPVGTQEFKYLVHTLADGYTVPDTKVGRRSSPGQVEFSAAEVAGFTQDYGLDDVIPRNDIDNAPPNYDPLGKATQFLTNLVQLDREIRVANLVFNTANYGAGLTATLAGTSQWSDYTNSDPLSAIMNALDGVTIRPTIAVFGRITWTKLRMHPKIVQAVLGVANTGAGQSAGTVSRKQLAELLELEDVLVGESFYNTARKGQTASLARAWGKHASFLVRDKMALQGKGATYGFTAQWGSRIAASWDVKENAGLKGGVKVRTGESVQEVLTCTDLGYFFQNAVA